MVSRYAHTLGVTEADARTARNVQLSVADCRHLRRLIRKMLEAVEHGDIEMGSQALEWTAQLDELFKGAV